jgi:hypothetical protein
MVSRESQQLLMSFNDKSRVETFPPFPDVEIENYLDQYRVK